jgi:subtilisin family serine protease
VDVPFADETAERDALQTSAEAGTIHCLAAGNERGKRAEDCNKLAIQTSPYVITVAALSSQGIFASYGCFGANVFVTAPSSSFRDGEYLITTTDRLGTNGYNNVDDPVNPYPDRDYTADFGGTSSACPLVAGIMALGLQANPNMTVRLAKHLLVRSSDRVDLADATETSDGGC